MKLVSRLFVVLLAAVLAVRVWMALFPSPARVIRQRLAAVAQAASFGPEQGALSSLAAAARLKDFFAADAEAVLDLPGRGERRLRGREEIQQAALGARSSLGGLSVSFPEITLNLAPDGESAMARVVLEARVSGSSDTIVQPMDIELRKSSGQWLIIGARTVQGPLK